VRRRTPTGVLAGAKYGARASRPQKNKCGQDARAPKRKRPKRRPRIWERGRFARNDQCGQDARAPKRKRPKRRPRIWERGRPARKKTNAGKMPALPRGSGLNAVRESGSAGVPPATTNAGKMPALPRGSGLNAVRESGSAGVPPANYEGSEKPRKRGLRFAMGSKPRPGVKRRAFRPPTAAKARERAFGLADCLTRPRCEGPWAGLCERIGPNAATARTPGDGPWPWPISQRGCRCKRKVVHVDN